MVRNVLVSVFDKTNLEALLTSLSGRGVTLYSTGGTFRELEGLKGDFALVSISDLTGYPEMPGGLVKTLHPKIHAGILAEPFKEDQDAYLREIGATEFDLVVCNLYPFERVSETPGVEVETMRQTIDIGGPTLVRAAAKNLLRVATLVDPEDYFDLGVELSQNDGSLGLATRVRLAQKAFRHVRDYDAAICRALDSLTAAQVVEAYQVV